MLEEIRPRYAKAFHCIGSDCEDTCCHGLDVVIDEAGYRKLHALPAIQQRVNQHFVILSNPSASQYARIQLTQSFACPFLSSERLCGIQKEHGEYYLADICTTYPRVTQRIDGLRETALLLSCPEAARLVLLNPTLVVPTETGLPRYHRFTQSVPQLRRTSVSPHQYLWDIRAFTLLLIQDRTYPLWQRLFMLGMFCKQLHEITRSHQLALTPQLLNEYAQLITQSTLRSSMDSMPVRSGLQLAAVIKAITHQLQVSDCSHVRFRECVEEFMLGIRWKQDASLDGCASFYTEAYSHYFQPFMRERPHIMENYLLNHIFRTRFPYGVDAEGNPNDAFTEYLLMCLFYAVIKALLVGIAGYYRDELAESHVVKAVQSFAKIFEQSKDRLTIPDLGLANRDGIALLLKDE